MTWTRRSWVTRCAGAAWGAWATPTLLGACATAPDEGADRIVDMVTGRSLAPDEVLRRMRDADVVLLGELHDNPRHHARRAELLARIGAPVPVIAEHLPRGAAPALSTDAHGDALRQTLAASGFDAKGWRWPLHEPLFAAVAGSGHALRGGNLDREAARRLARVGAAAMPTNLIGLTAARPLTVAARTALEQDLQQGHCGQLGADRTPGMVAAQRGRDAAMAEALLAQRERVRNGVAGGPVILLAGNGHLRLDYGVPSLLVERIPRTRVLSIGFLELEQAARSTRALFDITWSTAAATRDDPCKAFPAARPNPA